MNHPRLSEKLLAVLALLWLALTASAYFITHKPFSPDQALIAAAVLDEWIANEQRSSLLLAGVAAGFALGV